MLSRHVYVFSVFFDKHLYFLALALHVFEQRKCIYRPTYSRKHSNILQLKCSVVKCKGRLLLSLAEKLRMKIKTFSIKRQRANYDFCDTVTIDDILDQRNYQNGKYSTQLLWVWSPSASQAWIPKLNCTFEGKRVLSNEKPTW